MDGGYKCMKKYEFKYISVVMVLMILFEMKMDFFEDLLLNVVGVLNSFINIKKKKCSFMN